MERKPKERIIFDNYDLFSDEMIEYAKENLHENYGRSSFTEEEISNEIYFQEEIMFEDFEVEMNDFLIGYKWILTGTIGRWNGNFEGGFIFENFNEMMRACKDCDYIKVWDENGHLYLKCSHHDGTNMFEIKKLTENGEEYLDRHYWDMEAKDLHKQIMKRYSVLPNYAHNVYGCKKIEYKK